jgi:hypothetical protein
MNEWGPEGCQERITPIVGALLGEAARRGWALQGRPILSKVARLGIMAPFGIVFARAWARGLVLEAIRLSSKGTSNDEGLSVGVRNHNGSGA